MLLSAGSNARGQLSNGSLDDFHSFTPCSFLSSEAGILPGTLLNLTFGANHTLALLQTCNSDGELTTELWGCGDGSSGQLGPSYTGEDPAIFQLLDLCLERNGIPGYLPRLVCASWETTYVVLSRSNMPDILISMGANDFGDLGVGSKRGGKLPAKDFHVVGFNHLVDSRSLFVESLASGQHHVVVKLRTAAKDLVVGWGTSRHGQLGNVTVPFLSSPAIIQLGEPIVFAALGHQHTLFLHASGTVSGLGSNRKRQLEGISGTTHVQSIDCTWNGAYLITDNWDLLSAGSNSHGQLGRDSADGVLSLVKFPFTTATHRLSKIACGSEHVLACFVMRDSSATEVWGWGWNEHGNLGIGTTEDVRIPVRIWSDASGGAVGIWAGSGTSWIATP